MANDAPYPWQHEQWAQMSQSAGNGRLHHATLISGQAGVGKRDFAAMMAKLLLCLEFPAQKPCGQCARCQLLQAGTHPDFTVVDWLDKATVISVDQIRKLSSQLQLTATYGPYRIAIINRADSMTAAACNSLLKTLEEPPGSCALILLSERDAALPATIHSRCQRILMPAPDSQSAIGWLQQQEIAEAEIALEFARGAPLLAATFARERDLPAIANIREQWRQFLVGEKSPAALAAESANLLDTRESLTLFMQWTTDLVKNVEFSLADGRSTSEGARIERKFFSQALQLLQQSLRFDNASLKTLAVLEGVLADIRIQRIRTRAENSA